MAVSDEIIMQRVKEGNLQELAVLFERYHIRLFNYFLKHTSDRSVSQDLTQNLFYRLIKYKNTFKEDNSFKSWIYQMARNVHIDYCKFHQKESEKFSTVENHSENVADYSDSFSEDEYQRLDVALSQLGTDQKEIIILSRYQGLRYEEISRIKNMSVSAIKVQVHRAVKQLRTLYFKYA